MEGNFWWWFVLIITILSLLVIPGLWKLFIESIKEYKKEDKE